MLALIIALSAYLRQASENAQELAESIRGNKIWNYPYYSPLLPHTDLKLALLRRTRNALSKVATWMINLSFVLSVRTLGFAIWSLDWSIPYLDFILRYFDVIIAIGLIVLFIILTKMHYTSRKANEEIRTLAREWEKGQVSFSQ